MFSSNNSLEFEVWLSGSTEQATVLKENLTH